MRIETPEAIASAILAAPGWERVGITAPSKTLREEAALELANAILTPPSMAGEAHDESQLSLFS